ncbi:OmpA family protein [Blastococcus sp. CT_GayMR20]|uniref:OmpA family protein n=1 Tax=Blastococcus sp. CT_GayMR20 TaxID=2559609 RepID=UPI001073D345|nr:OmpA family protein [Blastococcus sp. CT_GayMR20]TFV88054.1 OmpA family protein [Blastococcus sp. CT_GayMR20]
MSTDGRAPQAHSTTGRSTTRWQRRALIALLIAVAVLLTAGCTGSTQPDDGVGPGPSAARCESVAGYDPEPDGRYEVLIVDRTASQAPRAMPPAVVERLRAAQEADRTLMLIGVDGPGIEPRLGRTLPLDPMPEKTSRRADDVRTLVLDCVQTWIEDDGLLPTATGSDQLAALAAAGRQQPEEILVISDGVSSSRLMDLAAIGYDSDAASVAAALSSAGVLPRLGGATVLWAGLGETTLALSEAARAGLETLWTHVLAAAGSTASFDRRFQSSEAGATAGFDGLPEDPMPSEEPFHLEGAGASCFRLPSGTVFGPNSTEVVSTAGLEQVAATLTQHPGWVAVVSGHVADYGPVDGQVPFSEARAHAVVRVLRDLGVPESVELVALGYGATRPVESEWVDGVHDEAAAAKNRRVDVLYGDPASVDPDMECAQG